MFRSYAYNASNLAGVTVGAGTNGATIGPFSNLASRLTFSAENTGGTALATLVLQGKVTAGDLAFQTIASGTNWAANTNLVVGCSSGLATQGTTTAGFAVVNVAGFTSLQFTATTATGTTTVNINPSFSDT